MNKDFKLIAEAYKKVYLKESHVCECGCDLCGLDCPCDEYCECKEGRIQETTDNSSSFVQGIKKSYGHLNPQFGIEDQGEHSGRMFAIMPVKYDDGDRWYYDTMVIYDGGGQSEGYSDEEVERLYSLTKKTN